MIERARAYIDGVLSGQIVVGKWIRLAIDRHVADLARVGSPDFPYHFDEDEAARILDLYKLFRFSKGKEAGQPFDIMPWWAALVYMAFGWRRNDGGKRFRKVYCKVGRGNAKTANLVTIGVIGFLFDGTEDPEVYWVATKKDQAKIGWDRQRKTMSHLLADFPELHDEVHIPTGHTSTRVSRKNKLSWVTYLGRDSQSEDGASPSLVLVDEYHAWPNDEMMNVMESGMVKVDDPVTWIITTAGYNPQGPNSEFLRACKNMLMGVADNPELLAFIYELDEGDDWQDRSVWGKANPGLGISLTMTGLETEYNKIATGGQQKEIDFKVKNLNIEYASQDGWIPDEVWMKGCEDIDLEQLRERECWGGLDLANTNDFNAFVLFFPPRFDGDNSYCFFWFWAPDESLEKFDTKRPFVRQWARDGYLKTTPGNVTDYDQILSDILEIVEPLNLAGVGYDKALSSYITPKLIENGVRMEPYSQAPLWLTPPAKHIERLALSETIRHDGNPVMRWMLANVTMQPTAAGNYYPSRGKSVDKIDGVAALLNAVGQWLKDRSEPVGKSYLFEEDLIIV